jgi:hypothetical protein
MTVERKREYVIRVKSCAPKRTPHYERLAGKEGRL